MKSDYANYVEETTTKFIYEDQDGFFQYEILGDVLYIQEIYIKPDMRKLGVGRKYINLGEEIANQFDCKYLQGSVIPGSSAATGSLAFQIKCGYELYSSTPYIIFLRKKIGE